MQLQLLQIHDFTGRYKINFDALKTSTLMGPVNPPQSSFNLNDFELTVLDQGDVIQLIGKYEGMPFSQMCPVIERTDTWLSANMEAAMDLTKLPYKAKIGAFATLTLEKQENKAAVLELMGEGTYERAASADKGADYNTYLLQAIGYICREGLTRLRCWLLWGPKCHLLAMCPDQIMLVRRRSEHSFLR
jgi:hypothetical protein